VSEDINSKLPAGNAMVQHLNLYTDPECIPQCTPLHTNRRTDRRHYDANSRFILYCVLWNTQA